MRGLARSLFKLEILVCFAPCAILLMVGAVMVPGALGQMIREPLARPSLLMMVLFVICGTIGLCTLLYVASVLLAGKEQLENPGRVFAGVVIGAAPPTFQLVEALATAGETQVRWGFLITMVGLPLLATTHIVSLSRRLLFAGLKRS